MTESRRAAEGRVWTLRSAMGTTAGLSALALVVFNLSLLVGRQSHASDYVAVYAAAHAYERAPELLYSRSFQAEVQRELGFTWFLPFYRLPYELIPFLMMARLDYEHSLLLWRLLSLGVLYLAVARIALLLTGHRPSLPLSLLVGLAFYPVMICLLQGQNSILLLALYALAFSALVRNRESYAGAWLGLGLFKPHLVLPLILVAAVQRRWRMAAGFAASAAVVLLLSVAMVGGEGMKGWVALVLQSQGSGAEMAVFPARMPNLRGLAALLLGEGALAKALTVLISAGLILVHARYARLPVARDLGFASGVCLTVFVSFHVNMHDLSLLLIPCSVLLWRASRELRFQTAGYLIPPFVIALTPTFFVLHWLDAVPLLAVPVGALWLMLMRASREEFQAEQVTLVT